MENKGKQWRTVEKNGEQRGEEWKAVENKEKREEIMEMDKNRQKQRETRENQVKTRENRERPWGMGKEGKRKLLNMEQKRRKGGERSASTVRLWEYHLVEWPHFLSFLFSCSFSLCRSRCPSTVLPVTLIYCN